MPKSVAYQAIVSYAFKEVFTGLWTNLENHSETRFFSPSLSIKHQRTSWNLC